MSTFIRTLSRKLALAGSAVLAAITLSLGGGPIGALSIPAAEAASATANFADASTGGNALVGGAAGTTIFVDTSSAGFSNNQALFALLCSNTTGNGNTSPCPNGTSYAATLVSSTGGTCVAPSAGNISATSRCQMTIPDAPASGSPGTTYTAIIGDSAHIAPGTLTVLAPSLSSPTSSPPGASVSLTVTDFKSGGTLGISASSGDSDFTSSCTPSSGEVTISGSKYMGTSATCSFFAPVTSTTNNPVTMTVDDGANSATTSFTVATPSLAITSSTASSGPVGSTVSLTGSNYRVSQPISIVSSGSDFTGGSSFTASRCRTDTSGSFTCTFVQAAASAGAATVTVADGANSASTTFTVLAPTISLATGAGGSSCSSNSCSGPAGSTITVTGSDYAIASGGATVFVSLAGVSTSCTADSSTGTLPASGSCTVTIPDAAWVNGGYNVTATDGVNTASQDGSANTAKFTISPSLSAAPTSGVAGSTVFATGAGFAGSAPISFTLAGTPASSTCSSASDGSFSCSVTVPSIPTGSGQVLQASDGSSPGATLSGGFNVTTGAQANAPTSMIVKKVSPNFGPRTGGTKKNPLPTAPTSKTVTNAITIAGSGFAKPMSVSFGSISVPSGSWTVNGPGTVIKAIPPACSTCGAVQVQVQSDPTEGSSDVSTAASLYFYGPQVTSIAPNFGSVATAAKTVTIHGHNLTGLSAINFVPAAGQSSGPTGVTFAQCSATSVDSCWKMTVPAQSGITGAYYVELVGPGGPAATSDIQSQISLFPSELYSFGPAVASISPTFGAAAGGNKLTIKGHGFTGATSVKVGHDTIPSSGFTITGDTTITVTSLPAQFSTDPAQVDVTVIGANGDSSPSVAKDVYSYGPLVLGVSPKSSGTGTQFTKVTITGKNFTGATQVNFGTIAVTSGFTVNSTGTAITLTSVPALPAGQTAGARYVTVVGSAGSTDVSAINTKAVFNIQ